MATAGTNREMLERVAKRSIPIFRSRIPSLRGVSISCDVGRPVDRDVYIVRMDFGDGPERLMVPMVFAGLELRSCRDGNIEGLFGAKLSQAIRSVEEHIEGGVLVPRWRLSWQDEDAGSVVVRMRGSEKLVPGRITSTPS
jgi:hypothetical protein